MRYSPAGKLSTFIYRIAYNLALNRIRDEGRRPASSLQFGKEGEEMVVPDSVERTAPATALKLNLGPSLVAALETHSAGCHGSD